MKPLKYLLAACLVALITTAHAKTMIPGTDLNHWLRTIPIVITTVSTPVLSLFWATMAAQGAVDIQEWMAEPLENYEVGIQHVSGATSATISWPDGDYPTRDIDAERTYDYNPSTRVAVWWVKVTHKTILQDGTITSETTYSQTPPLVNDFNNMDVHYNRIALAGSHQSSFSFDAFESVTCYAKRNGHSAWPRPIMAIVNGWVWVPVWRNDILYHTPIRPYQDKNYMMLLPDGYKLYKPHVEYQSEIYDMGVATLFFAP